MLLPPNQQSLFALRCTWSAGRGGNLNLLVDISQGNATTH